MDSVREAAGRHGFAAAGTVLILLIASVGLTSGDPTPQILVLLSGGAVVVSLIRPAVAVFAAVVIALSPLVTGGSGWHTLGIDTRFLSLPFVVALVIHVLRAPSVDNTPSPQAETRGHRWMMRLLAVPAMAAFGLLSLYWSAEPTRTLNHVLGLAEISIVCYCAARLLPIGQLLRVLAIVAGLVIGGSCLLFAVAPESAMMAGRFRGLFVNSNGLAAFLVVTCPLVVAQLSRYRWPVMLVVLGLGAATASRTGFAALVIEATIFAMRGCTARARVLGTSALVALSTLLITAEFRKREVVNQDILLLRTNNSRAGTWDTGFRDFQNHPILGLGLGARGGGAGGVVPELLGSVGLVGTALAVLFVGAVVLSTVRADAMYSALIFGSLTNLVFEPWLFAAGSGLCITFWLVASHPGSLTHHDPPARRPRVQKPHLAWRR